MRGRARRLTLDAADSHAGAGADEGREGLAVGCDELAALARVLLGLVEVKDKVLVIGEDVVAVSGTGGGMLDLEAG